MGSPVDADTEKSISHRQLVFQVGPFERFKRVELSPTRPPVLGPGNKDLGSESFSSTSPESNRIKFRLSAALRRLKYRRRCCCTNRAEVTDRSQQKEGYGVTLRTAST